MAKLVPATAKKVKELGINAKTEEEAREKLLEILNENGIDGMEDEDTDTLIEIAESFVEDGDGDSEESADDNEETQNDKLADEVEEETESDDDEEEGEDDNDDDSEEEDGGDEFEDMDRTELKAYIKDNELNITVKKSMSDDDIRELIRAAVAENDEEDNEPEEEEEAKSAPKASKKSAEKPAPKKDEKKAAKDEKKSEKKEKKEKKDTAGKRGTKLDPKNNEDDREAFDVLKKLFPEDEFNYAWVASAGVTIKHKGVNSNRSLVLIENCSKQADGSIKCNLYLLTFNKQLEVLDEAGIEYETCWSGAPLIKCITLDEAVEIISGLLDNIMSSVKKIDKKLGENRKKMEENLEKKAPKKATKKPEPEDDEDEEEAKPAPKKVVAKKSAVAAKKTVSKKK